MADFVLEPKSGVGELIDEYADGNLTYAQLEDAIRARGYSTTSLFEMVRHITPVRAAEQERK